MSRHRFVRPERGRPRAALSLVLALLAATALAGCSGEDADRPTGPLGVGDALEAGDGPVEVRGHLFQVLVPEGEMRLCAELRGERPPQCGGPSLVVRGLTGAIEGLEASANGTRLWSPRPVTLEGMLAGEVLSVAAG